MDNSKKATLVYHYSSKRKNLKTVFKTVLRNVINSNFIAFQFAKRDIKAQYRQSFLGILWSFFLPISTAALWLFLRNSGTVKMMETGISYPIYVFVGAMAWSILVDSITGPINNITAMRSTLSKINFPKVALVISSMYKTLFNTFIKILVLICLLIYFKQTIGVYVFLFPIGLLVLMLVGITIGLFITPTGLLYSDVDKLLNPLLQVLMYLSPVVFVIPKNTDNIYNLIVNYNPLSTLIINFRNSLIGLPFEHVSAFFLIALCSFFLFIIALIIFELTIPIITERIGG